MGESVSPDEAREVFRRAASLASAGTPESLDLPALIEIGRDVGLPEQTIVRAFLERQAGVLPDQIGSDHSDHVVVSVVLRGERVDLDARVRSVAKGLRLQGVQVATAAHDGQSLVALVCDPSPAERKARKDLFGATWIGPAITAALIGAGAVGVAQGFNVGDTIPLALGALTGQGTWRDRRRHSRRVEIERRDYEARITAALRALGDSE